MSRMLGYELTLLYGRVRSAAKTPDRDLLLLGLFVLKESLLKLHLLKLHLLKLVC